MAHRCFSWGQENWDGVGHNVVPISKAILNVGLGEDSWLLKLYFQEPGSCNLHLFDVQ